jgi:hypothetical protein
MNAQREKAVLWLRRKMINEAMAGGQSGFAVQMRLQSLDTAVSVSTIGLREARPRER